MTTLVQRLASARLNGGTVTVKPAEAPTDIAAAYAIQSEVASFLGPMSQAWKVGSTSKASQAKLGTDQPGSARVPTRYLFASDDEVPVSLIMMYGSKGSLHCAWEQTYRRVMLNME